MCILPAVDSTPDALESVIEFLTRALEDMRAACLSAGSHQEMMKSLEQFVSSSTNRH